MNDNKLITVVETAEFIKQAEKFMSDESRREFINYIATNPCSGDLIKLTITHNYERARFHPSARSTNLFHPLHKVIGPGSPSFFRAKKPPN